MCVKVFITQALSSIPRTYTVEENQLLSPPVVLWSHPYWFCGMQHYPLPPPIPHPHTIHTGSVAHIYTPHAHTHISNQLTDVNFFFNIKISRRHVKPYLLMPAGRTLGSEGHKFKANLHYSSRTYLKTNLGLACTAHLEPTSKQKRVMFIWNKERLWNYPT